MSFTNVNLMTATRDRDFVLSVADLEEFGLSRWAANRRVDAGLWRRLEPGIYLTHPLEPSWRSRARAALLLGGRGAFLSHESAWYLHELTPRAPHTITVGIPRYRRIKPRPGFEFHLRPSGLLVSGALPATAPEETVLDLIERDCDVLDVIGLLTQGFRKRMSRNKILFALERRPRYTQRDLLLNLLGHVDDGVESPLEFSYDTDVEGAHGLPKSRRQVVEKVGSVWIRADRVFDIYHLRIELDGQLGHPGGRTDRDMWRDNAVLLKHGDATLRYRWVNVLGRPCETAAQISVALQQRGWNDNPVKCKPDCTVLEYRA